MSLQDLYAIFLSSRNKLIYSDLVYISNKKMFLDLDKRVSAIRIRKDNLDNTKEEIDVVHSTDFTRTFIFCGLIEHEEVF